MLKFTGKYLIETSLQKKTINVIQLETYPYHDMTLFLLEKIFILTGLCVEKDMITIKHYKATPEAGFGQKVVPQYTM